GDIFENLIHLQKHRRARALQQLASKAEEKQLKKSTLLNLCVPLASIAILQKQATKESFDIGYADVSLKLLSNCFKNSGRSCWNKILEQIKFFAKSLKDFNDKVHERYLIRGVVACLNSYQFQEEGSKKNSGASSSSTSSLFESAKALTAEEVVAKCAGDRGSSADGGAATGLDKPATGVEAAPAAKEGDVAATADASTAPAAEELEEQADTDHPLDHVEQ
ncbi:unnamed protein product, partial [Amoebophrya sp. A120]